MHQNIIVIKSSFCMKIRLEISQEKNVSSIFHIMLMLNLRCYRRVTRILFIIRHASQLTLAAIFLNGDGLFDHTFFAN